MFGFPEWGAGGATCLKRQKHAARGDRLVSVLVSPRGQIVATAIVNEDKHDDGSSIESRGGISRTTPVEDLPQFLSVEEFGAYLQIGRGLAYELARTDPRFRTVRIGRLLRIPRAALLEMAKEVV